MNPKKTLSISRVIFNGKDVINIRFKYNITFADKLKHQLGAEWNAGNQCWNIAYSTKNLKALTSLAKDNYIIQHDRTPIKTGEEKHPASKFPPKVTITLEMDETYNRLFVRFPYNKQWKNELKKLDGAWWHIGEEVWSVALTDYNIEKVKSIFEPAHPVFLTKIIDHNPQRKQVHKSPIDYSIIDKMYIQQLKMLNRSKHTIKNYSSMIAHFLHHFEGKEIGLLSEAMIRQYIMDHRERQGYSESYQRIMISALKSYYKIVFKRELDEAEIPFPKKSITLPKVISQKDVEKMIQLTVNPKHKMILLMLYGLGLRNAELTNLRLNDIDFKREVVTIYNAKGRKDRQVPLPEALKRPISTYIRDFAPKVYFITGQFGGRYSGSSIDKVVKLAAERANVKFNVTPHVLRHCFATHSLEKGIDLRYIQVMLGHKSSRTTEIYTHVSTSYLKKIGNPLDDITI